MSGNWRPPDVARNTVLAGLVRAHMHYCHAFAETLTVERSKIHRHNPIFFEHYEKMYHATRCVGEPA